VCKFKLCSTFQSWVFQTNILSSEPEARKSPLEE
jgi:hypothetical protein